MDESITGGPSVVLGTNPLPPPPLLPPLPSPPPRSLHYQNHPDNGDVSNPVLTPCINSDFYIRDQLQSPSSSSTSFTDTKNFVESRTDYLSRKLSESIPNCLPSSSTTLSSPSSQISVSSSSPSVSSAPLALLSSSSTSSTSTSTSSSSSIGWNELDKGRFFTLMPLSNVIVRGIVYPASLIKTRLQAFPLNKARHCNNVCSSSSPSSSAYIPSSWCSRCPDHTSSASVGQYEYRGTMDGLKRILQNEGVRGLYRGFGVSLLSLANGPIYISVIELCKHHLPKLSTTAAANSHNIKPDSRFFSMGLSEGAIGFVAGFAGSLASQVIAVPIDVVSQRIMIHTQAISDNSLSFSHATPIISKSKSSNTTSTPNWARGHSVSWNQQPNPYHNYDSLVKNNKSSNSLNIKYQQPRFTYQSLPQQFSSSSSSSSLPYLFPSASWSESKALGGNVRVSTGVGVTARTLEAGERGAHKLSLSIVRDIYRESGILGFYRGFTLSLVNYAPYSAILWATYSHTQAALRKFHHSETTPQFYQRTPRPILGEYSISIISGTIAGITAAMCTHPLDVIKTRLQVDSNASARVRSTISNLLKEQGFKSLFVSGLSARLWACAPSSGLMMLSYEIVKNLSAKP